MAIATGLYECPSCSQPLTFVHGETQLIVCGHCHTPVERLEGDVLVTKPVLVLTFPNEVIQIGTRGYWKGIQFKVIGRVRFSFEETAFNYWTIVFDTGVVSYLGEGYGIYSILEKVSLTKATSVHELNAMSFDHQTKELLGDSRYHMLRKSSSDKYEIEGEVLLPFSKGVIKVFELASEDAKHLEIFGFERGLMASYAVEFTDFSGLNLSNLRPSTYNLKEFNCPKCGNKITVKTFPYAQSCACDKCGSKINLRDFSVMGRNRKEAQGPYIKLGSKGTIKEVEYEVIGFTLKQETNEYESRWVEYTLHNPTSGYAFISEFDGNFVFIKENCDSPVLYNHQVRQLDSRDETFMLYNRYTFSVLNAVGEFPGNAFDDNAIAAYEFISPPEMWILERRTKEGYDWFLGEHLSREIILEQFPCDLPPKGSIGAVEPKGYMNIQKLVLATAVAVLLVLLVHLLIGSSSSERIIYDETINLPDSTIPINIVTNRFKLTKWKSNIQINIAAPVNNSWFELSGTLVNANTGTEYSFEQGVEYYSGYDGEYWSEGSTSETIYLSSIPAGTYFLQLQATKEPYRTLRSFNLAVKNDVPMTRNAVIILVLLLIWPVVKFIQVQSVEKKRWYNSPFTPYTYED